MSPQVFDITVYTEDPIRQRMANILQSPDHIHALHEITKIDDHVAVLVQAINQSKAKRDFWKALADDPAEFIKRWVSSQKRDLDTLCGESPDKMVEEEDARKAIQWREKVGESVYLLLTKQRA